MMKRAFALAMKVPMNKAGPGPQVGAVFTRGGRIIAEAAYERSGGPHAEARAIANAKRKGRSLKNSTLYVTLEPCVDFSGKRTPSCTDAIIKAKPKRVVIAQKDPNPRVCGRGISLLRRAGIPVQVLSYVAVKFAMSLDGKIATRTGESKWITGRPARRYAKKLRDKYDAVLVGVNTVIHDNPRLKGAASEPVRIILDSHLRSPINSRVFGSKGGLYPRAIVATTDLAPKSRLSQFKKRGIPLLMLGKRIRIPLLLRILAKRSITNIFVEGGAEVIGSFIDARKVNYCYAFIAPKIVGGANAKSAVGGRGISRISKAIAFNNCIIIKISQDMLVEGALSSI